MPGSQARPERKQALTIYTQKGDEQQYEYIAQYESMDRGNYDFLYGSYEQVCGHFHSNNRRI
jgi:hypothetical protein